MTQPLMFLPTKLAHRPARGQHQWRGVHTQIKNIPRLNQRTLANQRSFSTK